MMNCRSSHFVAGARPLAAASDTAAVDTAWLVLEAANDLGDEATLAVCRRVIDASLTGAAPAADDLHVVQDYFR
jgi:hypothetical protein